MAWEIQALSRVKRMWMTLILLLIFFTVCLSQSRADWGGIHVNWLDGLTRILCKVLHRHPGLVLPLPEQGPAIVAANHVSGLDPLLLIAASRRPLRFLIAAEEYHRPVLHWIFKAAGCIPVDRQGRAEQALRAARRALEKGEIIALFPHGKIHLDTDSPRPIKAGVIRLAKWTTTPIYPVRLDGIKAQGQVLLAPFVPSHVQISVGEPLQPSLEMEQLKAQLTRYIETAHKHPHQVS